MIQEIIMLNVKGLSCLSVCVLARRANFARIKSNKFSWLLELRFPFSRHFSTQSRTLQRQWTSSMNSTPSTTQGLMRTRKDVVTAFIRKSNATVLLVRRSDQVGSYKNYWGGVSGGVEGSESLLRRAQIEVWCFNLKSPPSLS